jgi:hypothetical protein
MGGIRLRMARSLFHSLCAALVVVPTMLSAGGSAAAADSVPFRDSNAKGSLGLCDKNKQPITSGSVYDQPFVWTAVSSAAAPKGYTRGKSILTAFQPRQGVEPGLWSGQQLTASSSFTNPRHPMAQSTNADEPLISFVQAFPPKWEGLIQLRMYFSASDSTVHREPYPATVIRITGDRWSVVSGSRGDCKAGKATSLESQTLPKSALASQPPVVVAGSPRPTVSSSTQANERKLAASTSDGAGAGPVAVVLVALAAAGGVVGLLVLRRSRSGVKGS